MATDVKVPALGESISEATVLEWLVQPGQYVEADQDIVSLETDKVSMNVPAPVSGVLEEHLVQPEDEVEVGSVIARIAEGAQPAEGASAEGSDGGGDRAAQPEAPAEHAATSTGEAASPAGEPTASAGSGPSEAPATAEAAAPRGASGPAPDRGGDGAPPMMPAVRRLVEEHGLDPRDIPASGRGGRLLKEDVLAHVEGRKAGATPEAEAEPAPSKPAEPRGEARGPAGGEPDERDVEVRMSPLRRRIAQNLVASQQNAALLTTFNEVDMSEIMAVREAYKKRFEEDYGVRLGFMSFFTKAAIEALKAHPVVNAEVRGDTIVYKNRYDIGIAVGGGRGLVVPVVRDADRLSFAEIERTIGDLADKAVNNKLTPEDLQGGTFTISNGGVYGSLVSTPLLNPPQSGVLGMHKIEKRPVAVGDQVTVRPMMYLALTYDHRIVDGREAVQFLVRVKEVIEDPRRLFLEV